MEKFFYLRACRLVHGDRVHIIRYFFTRRSPSDPRLLGQTSLWMFPIYGMAALIDPIYEKIKYWPFLLRGCFYATSIMLGEFLSGSLLRFLGVCPWDYSGTPYNIAGIVRLDYFPFWVVAGLAFEVLLRFLDERNSLSEDVSSRPHV